VIYTSAGNPILVALREDWGAERLPHGELVEAVERAISRPELPAFLSDATREHVEHARKVLGRLAFDDTTSIHKQQEADNG
jgi:hypothetical protein